MNQYILDTKFAAEELIKLIRYEESQLLKLEELYVERKKHHDFLHDDFRRKEFDPDDHFNEFQMMHAFNKQADYQQKVLQPILDEIKILEDSMENKKYSISSLSGSLLQIAKQGISFVHHGLVNCKDGRQIRNDVLKNVIWQGRNQSIHFEEGNYKKPLRDCFNNLGYTTVPLRNLGKEIIDILGWTSYQKYENDMNSLL
ncbi:hypothetical protein [Paenibacillus apiarius]|uniref:hypothetical protein n=1 Tax=Paenibacillus apiarius TaxID=46240 RepID=UPI00197F75A8|nr:hypothetical protein [Paenibacillus apiarius]MBN3526419.1 hypothetical protein [Paenibacillus apiarius]